MPGCRAAGDGRGENHDDRILIEPCQSVHSGGAHRRSLYCWAIAQRVGEGDGATALASICIYLRLNLLLVLQGAPRTP
jgi:hypothetical protein